MVPVYLNTNILGLELTLWLSCDPSHGGKEMSGTEIYFHMIELNKQIYFLLCLNDCPECLSVLRLSRF